MTNSITIAGLPEPVPIPVELGSTPLDEYAALLLRLTEAQRTLADAEARHREAEDRIWATIVERLYPAVRQSVAAGGSSGAERFEPLVRAIEQLLAEQGIETLEFTGQRLAELRSADVEVLCTRPTQDFADDGLIAETWRPAVRRHSRTVQTGQVVVFKHTASPSAEDPS
jgi:hypothetical protein